MARRTANTNSHVDRLHRFLPFSTAHDQIYEEYQTGEDDLDLETVAVSYAAEAIKSGARCVILTGDAGHGKTHMCRRLIEEKLLGHDAATARSLLLSRCDGSALISAAAGETHVLRIHKDLSEMKPPSRAASFLEQHANREGETLVVCANEGRLRAILNSEGAGKHCRAISDLFHRSFEQGVTADPSGQIHIVNLNYQSVAANSPTNGGSFLRRVVESWVNDRRRWSERSCGSCISEGACPIRRNRAMLAEFGELSTRRVERLQEVFEVIERLGHVVTVREMLMLVAYLITGGLRCADVHRKLETSSQGAGWQPPWAFYNLLFAPPPNLSVERVDKGIPVLSAVRRLDPGSIAVRHTDERILNLGNVFELGQLDLQFTVLTGGKQLKVDAALGIDDFNGNPQTKADLAREAEASALAVAALRRRTFFDDASGGATVMSRLGFRHGDVFLALLREQMATPEKVKLKNMIIAGLHVIQGLRMQRAEATLYLVDPAFGRASADAAIIARQVPGSKINLQRASKAWIGGGNGATWFLPYSVDWIDRAVVFTVDERLGELRDLPLDLLSFECVGRAATGYVNEEFYANEIRRIRTFLGQLAESGRGENGQISVFMEGRLQNVSLDMDVIQVGGQ